MLVITVCFWLLGCVPSTDSVRVNPTEVIALIDNHWLYDNVCERACWHGILPGKTTFVEADAILVQFPSHYLEQTRTTLLPVEIYREENEDIVRIIRYDPKGSLTIQDVFNSLGEPSHIDVLVYACDICPKGEEISYSIYLVYRDYGISIGWTGYLIEDGPTDYSPNSIIDGVEFFYPPDIAWRELDTWQGFIDFEGYCKKRPCYSVYPYIGDN